MSHRLAFIALLAVTTGPVVIEAADQTEALKAIHSVGKEGAGNKAAAEAVKVLSTASANEIPGILDGFAGASPLAANYLRSAVEAIADQADGKLPTKDIERFVFNREADPRARRLGYELLLQVDDSARGRIIPQMLLDPSPEFRRDAVELLMLEAGTRGEKANAVKAYRKALTGATDADQVKAIAEALKGFEEEVDLARHYGFLTSWQIIGPFNNREFVGFNTAYPPEKTIDFGAKLEGQLGEVAWGKISTEDDYGILDVAKSVSPYKGAVMYLTTGFSSPTAQDVQFRLGTPNAWKVWLNGELLFGRDEYHRGMAIDQYRVDAKLKAGPNVILVKLCQNEQEDSWAQRYQLQFRVCENSGIAVHPSRVTATTSQLTPATETK